MIQLKSQKVFVIDFRLKLQNGDCGDEPPFNAFVIISKGSKKITSEFYAMDDILGEDFMPDDESLNDNPYEFLTKYREQLLDYFSELSPSKIRKSCPLIAKEIRIVDELDANCDSVSFYTSINCYPWEIMDFTTQCLEKI
ncbi:hypothetical protein [Vibrio owensii]|uniref:hypothetical protein n=1 Tax=Vibrio owensii TaxID=696485 RepID=UPI003CC68923